MGPQICYEAGDQRGNGPIACRVSQIEISVLHLYGRKKGTNPVRSMPFFACHSHRLSSRVVYVLKRIRSKGPFCYEMEP